jgi:hypothetical protein
MNRGNGLPGTISLFAIGVAVGAALGVLFAPKSGEQTREIIADRLGQHGEPLTKRRNTSRKRWKSASGPSTAQDVPEHLHRRIREARKPRDCQGTRYRSLTASLGRRAYFERAGLRI